MFPWLWFHNKHFLKLHKSLRLEIFWDVKLFFFSFLFLCFFFFYYSSILQNRGFVRNEDNKVVFCLFPAVGFEFFSPFNCNVMQSEVHSERAWCLKLAVCWLKQWASENTSQEALMACAIDSMQRFSVDLIRLWTAAGTLWRSD